MYRRLIFIQVFWRCYDSCKDLFPLLSGRGGKHQKDSRNKWNLIKVSSFISNLFLLFLFCSTSVAVPVNNTTSPTFSLADSNYIRKSASDLSNTEEVSKTNVDELHNSGKLYI